MRRRADPFMRSQTTASDGRTKAKNEPFFSVRNVKNAALDGCDLSYVHATTGARYRDMRALFEIALVDFADKIIIHRGTHQRISSGQVGLRSPFEVGKLVRVHESEVRARFLALGAEEMQAACEALGVRPRDLPSVISYGAHEHLFSIASSVFEAVETGAPTVHVQTQIASCSMNVVRLLCGISGPGKESCADSPSARRIRAMLHDCWAEDLSLDALAREVSLSRSYVVHAFQKTYHVSPFEYLMKLRVARAREILNDGGRPIDAAHACGFCDQSHLNRWFTRSFGVTPGSYATSVASQSAGRGRRSRPGTTI
jgi:AraC-like DNA-binding protein